MTGTINVKPKRPTNLIIDDVVDDNGNNEFRTPAAPRYPFFGKSPSDDSTSNESSPDTPNVTCYGVFSEKHHLHMKQYSQGRKRIYYKKIGSLVETQVTTVIDHSFVKEQNISIELWFDEYKQRWDDAIFIGMLDNRTFRRDL